MTPLNESQFKETLRSLHPSAPIPPTLNERVAALAAGTDAGTHRDTRTMRLVLGLATGACALVAIGIISLFVPRPVLALNLREVSANLRLHQSRGYHSHLVMFDRNKANIVYDLYLADGKWRADIEMNNTRTTQIKANGLFWNYNRTQGWAWYQKDTGTDMMTGSVQRLLADVQLALNGGNSENFGMETVGNRRLQKVAVPEVTDPLFVDAKYPGRRVFWIDRATMLPAITEVQERRDGNWTTLSRAEFTFGDQGPETFTVPQKGVRIYDIHSFGVEAGKQFARPIAQKVFPRCTIALRDVQVNKEGDVFVLYTDGSTRQHDAQSYPRITDNRGTVYAGTAGGIEPFMYHQNKELSRGMMVGKEILRGVCVVPVQPAPGPWQPRTFTISIDAHHYIGKKQVTRSARFTVAIHHPTTQLLPTYADKLAALSLSGGDVTQFKQEREGERRGYFYNKEDWPTLLDLTDRALREGSDDVNIYTDRAWALGKMGRLEEARATLVEARRHDPFRFHRTRITKMEKQFARQK